MFVEFLGGWYMVVVGFFPFSRLTRVCNMDISLEGMTRYRVPVMSKRLLSSSMVSFDLV